MNPADDRTHLLQLSTGYWISKALSCAAKFRWADHIHAGKTSVEEIAEASRTVPEMTHRILRALASVGVFEETEPGRFQLTPKAEYLRSDHPESVRDFAHMVGWDLFEAWVHLDATVEGDAPAIFKAFGENYFREIGGDPEKVRLFDGAMQAIHGPETPFLLAHHDFSSHRTFMDVGGGNGGNLHGFLRHHPEARGILFDLPAVVEGARNTLPDDEVTARIDFSPGDFFVGVPGEADAILMRHIIHDWDDERSTMILNHAKRALEPGGTIYLLEKIIAPGNDPGFEKLLDLNMMVIGGKERTASEYEHLAAAADLQVTEMRVLPGPVDVIALQP